MGRQLRWHDAIRQPNVCLPETLCYQIVDPHRMKQSLAGRVVCCRARHIRLTMPLLRLQASHGSRTSCEIALSIVVSNVRRRTGSTGHWRHLPAPRRNITTTSTGAQLIYIAIWLLVRSMSLDGLVLLLSLMRRGISWTGHRQVARTLYQCTVARYDASYCNDCVSCTL